MDAVLTSGEEYDAVLILRGGGARLDLACFDDYSLAAVIAQYLPRYVCGSLKVNIL